MNTIQLNYLNRVTSSNGAEISDFDPGSDRLFVVAGNTIEIYTMSSTGFLTAAGALGPGITPDADTALIPNSVAVNNGVVAVAYAVRNTITNAQQTGKVAFFTASNGNFIKAVDVGALPDMLTFTPDGKKVLVANEGEPNSYNQANSVDPEGSVSIIDITNGVANATVQTATFTNFNSQIASLKVSGVRIFGLNATVAQDLEPEYIAVAPDGLTARITLQENNAVAVLDIATATITQIIPLGAKNHNLPGNGIDPSDQDGGINIRNVPVFGLYQPDAIASFTANGQTYYITANEGDARAYPGLNEEVRVSSLDLDTTVFPDASTLKQNNNLGRLTVTNATGNTDADPQFERIEVFGARSFSIWDDQGQLVFDSGDQLEQITKQITPNLFNANNGNPADFDTRSDNKGPEPESVTIGIIDGKTYGFIGLERSAGGVMVYDLSNPAAPIFIQYIYTTGDIAPEGLKFISAQDSPSGKPLLAVSNESSNTVSVYEIGLIKLNTYDFTNLPKLGTTSTNQDIFLGGFSGLYFQGVAANGNLQFVTHTDRGPNGEPIGQNRPFLLPNFQPEIVSFELNKTTNEITITKRTGLFRQDGTTPLTGLPNVQAGAGGTAYTDEIGINLNGQVLPNDVFGADLEGIVIAANGDYWMVDEYRPAIYHFDVNGKLIDRFIPQGTAAAANQTPGTFGTEILPAIYAQRRNNRGFEAVALEGNKLYAFIQTPIDNPDNSGDTTSRNSRNLRILEFNIFSQQVTGEYLYLLDDITGTGNAKTDKIGDAVSLGNGKFAVVERDDRSDANSNKLIYQINLATATNIYNSANFTLPAGKTIEQLTPSELTAAGITAVSKSLIVNAAKVGYTGVEKLEGLALISPNTLAIINDNDFNVAGTTIPEKLGIIELVNNLPVATITGTSETDSLTAFTSGYTVLGLAGDDYISAVETGTGNNILDGGDGNDEIFAKENDIALGGLGNDRLYSDGQGNNSNNTFYGGDGNDEIKPYRNDSVFGGAGDDIIYGGLGGNTITGGIGKDKFYLTNINEPENPNTITDYNPAEDSLLLNGNSNAELIFTTAGNNTLVSVDGKKLATLQNYQLPTFSVISASATEGNSISFTVTRTGNTQVSQNVTVSTSRNQDDTASENDFTAKTETLTFALGETTKVFTVITTQDQRVEKDETFTVALSNPTNGALIDNNNNRAKGVIINDDIPLVTPNNNYVFPLKGEGDQVRLRVSLVGRNSNSINELGVFTVDDAQGNINGIAPGAPGYNQSVITRAKVIFSAISNLPNGFNTGDFTRLINFNSGDNLRFFLVQGGTVDSLISGRTPLSNLLIADNFNQKTTDLGTDGFTLSWQDGSRNVVDFQDLVVKVQSTNDELVIGTGLQGGNQGEIIDLRDIKGQVKADFSVYREAAFNNEVYFYKIDNADGQIGGLIATSANRANYLQTALNNLIKDAQTGANIRFSAGNQGIQTGTTTISGGTLLAPMIIVNGTLSQLLDENTNNDPQVYFPYMGVNSDGVDHIRLLGSNTFGFEDLPNGGDLDYNDIIIKINFTQIV